MPDPTDAVTHHEDARGGLVAVELSRLAFSAQRAFVVVGREGGSDRGDHIIPCEQLMVLISGSVSVRVGTDREHLAEAVVLDTPGASLPLPAGRFVRYRLDGPHCSVMVLAEEPFRGGES